jgi:hypothetical protein
MIISHNAHWNLILNPNDQSNVFVKTFSHQQLTQSDLQWSGPRHQNASRSKIILYTNHVCKNVALLVDNMSRADRLHCTGPRSADWDNKKSLTWKKGLAPDRGTQNPETYQSPSETRRWSMLSEKRVAIFYSPHYLNTHNNSVSARLPQHVTRLAPSEEPRRYTSLPSLAHVSFPLGNK